MKGACVVVVLAVAVACAGKLKLSPRSLGLVDAPFDSSVQQLLADQQAARKERHWKRGLTPAVNYAVRLCAFQHMYPDLPDTAKPFTNVDLPLADACRGAIAELFYKYGDKAQSAFCDDAWVHIEEHLMTVAFWQPLGGIGAALMDAYMQHCPAFRPGNALVELLTLGDDENRLPNSDENRLSILLSRNLPFVEEQLRSNKHVAAGNVFLALNALVNDHSFSQLHSYLKAASSDKLGWTEGIENIACKAARTAVKHHLSKYDWHCELVIDFYLEKCKYVDDVASIIIDDFRQDYESALEKLRRLPTERYAELNDYDLTFVHLLYKRAMQSVLVQPCLSRQLFGTVIQEALRRLSHDHALVIPYVTAVIFLAPTVLLDRHLVGHLHDFVTDADRQVIRQAVDEYQKLVHDNAPAWAWYETEHPDEDAAVLAAINELLTVNGTAVKERPFLTPLFSDGRTMLFKAMLFLNIDMLLSKEKFFQLLILRTPFTFADDLLPLSISSSTLDVLLKYTSLEVNSTSMASSRVLSSYQLTRPLRDALASLAVIADAIGGGPSWFAPRAGERMSSVGADAKKAIKRARNDLSKLFNSQKSDPRVGVIFVAAKYIISGTPDRHLVAQLAKHIPTSYTMAHRLLEFMALNPNTITYRDLEHLRPMFTFEREYYRQSSESGKVTSAHVSRKDVFDAYVSMKTMRFYPTTMRTFVDLFTSASVDVNGALMDVAFETMLDVRLTLDACVNVSSSSAPAPMSHSLTSIEFVRLHFSYVPQCTKEVLDIWETAFRHPLLHGSALLGELRLVRARLFEPIPQPVDEAHTDVPGGSSPAVWNVKRVPDSPHGSTTADISKGPLGQQRRLPKRRASVPCVAPEPEPSVAAPSRKAPVPLRVLVHDAKLDDVDLIGFAARTPGLRSLDGLLSMDAKKLSGSKYRSSVYRIRTGHKRVFYSFSRDAAAPELRLLDLTARNDNMYTGAHLKRLHEIADACASNFVAIDPVVA
ncbi:unnamed protein product (mitochondrion) [Plasmodiophora brassicae]|uniref:Uncharacterized protein n=1 Tax=Plasmodiophora brassicae TaxID=37360 RepID=A0A3P3YQ88_PLABS|nr:unnamed protein product [Plasmodiophora brassicae]